jgi:hypothetical protein
MLFVVVFACGQTHVSSAHAASPYQFAESAELTISEPQLTAAGGVKVRLLNNTNVRWKLLVRAIGFALKPQSDPVDTELHVQTQQTVLRAASHATVTLSLPAATSLAKGMYSGELVASPQGKRGPAIRRAVVIEANTAATPAVKTLNAQAEWLLPGHHWLRRGELPLEPSAGLNAAALNLSSGEVLGYLTGSNGGTARATWNGGSVRVFGGTAMALKLDVDGFGAPGTYTGTISLLPGDPSAGDVNVSIVYTDSVFWPILLLGLGIVAAVMVQKVAQVQRVVWQLRGQLADLGVWFESAQERFAAATQGKTYASYSITNPIDKENSRLDALAQQLKGSLATSLDKERHTEAVKGIAALKDVIDGWAPPDNEETLDGFAKELDHLASSLEQIESLAIKSGPPEYGDGLPVASASTVNSAPEILTALSGLLRGTSFTTLGNYRSRRKEIEAAADFADAWLQRASSIEAMREMSSQFQGKKKKKKKKRDAWEAAVQASWRTLWNASTLAGLASIGQSAAVRSASATLGEPPAGAKRTEARVALTKLASTSGAPGLPGGLSLTATPTTTGAESPRLVAVKSLATVDYEARAKEYRARLAQSRWLLAAVSFVVAVVTGLTLLYFGKAWGTATDFVTAFFWGLMTQTAVSGLIAVLAPDSNPLSIPASPVKTKPTEAALAT